MALNISAWSIRNPLPSVVFSIILLVLGWASFGRLAVTRLPSADIPMISVAVAQFGAAPTELESQITKTIEDAVSGVEGMRHISSNVTDGLSVTTIQFALETNTDRAINDVKDAVTRVRAQLPQNVTEPLIQRIDVIGLPIVTYAAIAPGKTPQQLSYFVDDVVKRSLQGVRGVAQVERIGGVEREILVSLDPDRLQAMGLTAVNVSQMLRGTNVDLAGGVADIGGHHQTIRTLAGAKTLAELAGTMIPLFGGGEVRLDDLGTVTDTIAVRQTFARFNGEPVVALAVKRSKGASDVVVAQAVQKRIDALAHDYPDVELKLIDTSVEYTKGNYEAAISTLFEGAALAVVIVLLFLRNLRATVIAAISLPLSIFPAFWVMDLLGFSLNLVSFLAITLSTGILVDDAIVEIENIVRHINMGKSAYRAALEAADEIGLAVIAISLTIIAVFAPASFMSGIAGQFFKQFGITVSVQVFFSLLAARFVTPVLAAYFLKDRAHSEPPPGRILMAYRNVVTWSVQHYIITVVIGFLAFAASIGSAWYLPQGFLPAQDSARSLLAIELPPGTPLSYTEGVTEAVVTRLRKRPEVKSVFVDGGRVPPGLQEVRRASLIINYVNKSERKIGQHDLEFSITKELEDIPDARFWFLDENGMRAIQLNVTGGDAQLVNSVASDLAGKMKELPAVANVTSEIALERPELRILPKTDLAARLGVSTESLSQTIRVATMGDVGPALAKFDVGGRLVPIRVQLENASRGNLKVLEQLRVPLGEHGEKGGVPLSVIADVKLDQGPTTINRWDRQRQATITADLFGSSSFSEANAQIDGLNLMRTLPPGVKVSPSSDAESLAELSEGFSTAITAGLLMVYAVLVLLFGAFLQPVTILFSLPLSVGGAIGALLLTGKQLTIPVYIGILMLMGIVTKNAIMLVDFALEMIHGGMSREAAMIDAGMKRARPIVMTTVAMVAGMMPSAVGYGAGGEFRSPMALAVIGGLLLSTILSLVFVPAMFMVMDDVGSLLWRLGKRMISHDDGGSGSPRPDPKPPRPDAPFPAHGAAALTRSGESATPMQAKATAEQSGIASGELAHALFRVTHAPLGGEPVAVDVVDAVEVIPAAVEAIPVAVEVIPAAVEVRPSPAAAASTPEALAATLAGIGVAPPEPEDSIASILGRLSEVADGESDISSAPAPRAPVRGAMAMDLHEVSMAPVARTLRQRPAAGPKGPVAGVMPPAAAVEPMLMPGARVSVTPVVRDTRELPHEVPMPPVAQPTPIAAANSAASPVVKGAQGPVLTPPAVPPAPPAASGAGPAASFVAASVMAAFSAMGRSAQHRSEPGAATPAVPVAAASPASAPARPTSAARPPVAAVASSATAAQAPVAAATAEAVIAPPPPVPAAAAPAAVLAVATAPVAAAAPRADAAPSAREAAAVVASSAVSGAVIAPVAADPDLPVVAPPPPVAVAAGGTSPGQPVAVPAPVAAAAPSPASVTAAPARQVAAPVVADGSSPGQSGAVPAPIADAAPSPAPVVAPPAPQVPSGTPEKPVAASSVAPAAAEETAAGPAVRAPDVLPDGSLFKGPAATLSELIAATLSELTAAPPPKAPVATPPDLLAATLSAMSTEKPAEAVVKPASSRPAAAPAAPPDAALAALIAATLSDLNVSPAKEAGSPPGKARPDAGQD